MRLNKRRLRFGPWPVYWLVSLKIVAADIVANGGTSDEVFKSRRKSELSTTREPPSQRDRSCVTPPRAVGRTANAHRYRERQLLDRRRGVTGCDLQRRLRRRSQQSGGRHGSGRRRRFREHHPGGGNRNLC